MLYSKADKLQSHFVLLGLLCFLDVRQYALVI